MLAVSSSGCFTSGKAMDETIIDEEEEWGEKKKKKKNAKKRGLRCDR